MQVLRAYPPSISEVDGVLVECGRVWVTKVRSALVIWMCKSTLNWIR